MSHVTKEDEDEDIMLCHLHTLRRPDMITMRSIGRAAIRPRQKT